MTSVCWDGVVWMVRRRSSYQTSVKKKVLTVVAEVVILFVVWKLFGGGRWKWGSLQVTETPSSTKETHPSSITVLQDSLRSDSTRERCGSSCSLFSIWALFEGHYYFKYSC